MTRRLSPSRELVVLYVVTLVVTVGLTLAQDLLGAFRGYLLVLVAATFLYLPIEVLHRNGEDPEAFGIHRLGLIRHLRLAALAMVVTFPVYLVGFHLWQQYALGHTLQAEQARWARWPAELEGAPAEFGPPREGEVRLFAERDTVTLHWRLPLGQTFRADLDTDVPPRLLAGESVARPTHDGLSIEAGSDGFVRFDAGGQWLRAEVEAGGDLLPPERLLLGASRLPADENPYQGRRSLWWLLNLVLVQLLLVALPEEVFYRGYLQTRLDALFPRRVRLFGVEVSPGSLLLTSALFALGHWLVIPAPQRLAVFFPSLLFGWLKNAGGGVGVAVVYHAACNLLVEVASAYYG